MRFIFYDTETTGTNPAFDQILQFAAVLTDGELNEIDSFSVHCRLLPYVLPAPAALAVTGMSLSKAANHPTSHYAMVRLIRARLLDWVGSGALFAGWNSLRFDEEMLRQAFYQSLLPPYLTNTGGNGRFDVMKLAHAVAVVAPNALQVPRDADGRQSFRLERFAASNGIEIGNAHEALADTRATLMVARLIAGRAPRVFAEIVANAKRDHVRQRLAEAPLHFLVENAFGRAEARPVAFLVANADDPNEVALADLSVPPGDYLQAETGRIGSLFEAGGSPPLRRARLNKAPSLLPADLMGRWLKDKGISGQELLDRSRSLGQAAALRARVADWLSARTKERSTGVHLEERIYEKFPDRSDERVMAAFHEAHWQDRPGLIRELRDERLRSLGLRLIACERPDLLSEAERARWRRFLKARLFPEDEVPWLGAPQVLAALRERPMPEYHGYLSELARKLGVELPELA